MAEFYVYGHFTADDNTCFYVGKGHGNRLTSTNDRGNFWRSVAKKHGWRAEILQECVSEEEAFVTEKNLIAKYGRRDLGTGTLVNLTDGGEGNSGTVFSEERCRKISEARRGKPRFDSRGDGNPSKRPDVRVKISQAKKGVPKSPEHRAKLAAANLGKKRGPASDIHRARLSEARRLWWARKRGEV